MLYVNGSWQSQLLLYMNMCSIQKWSWAKYWLYMDLSRA